MAANQHTAAFDLSSEVRPRTASRVSFQKDDDAIDPSDVRVPVTGYEIMEQRARFTVGFLSGLFDPTIVLHSDQNCI